MEYVKEIKEMIERILVLDRDSIKNVYGLVEWKSGVDENVQSEKGKLQDIYYYMKGLIVGLENKEASK